MSAGIKGKNTIQVAKFIEENAPQASHRLIAKFVGRLLVKWEKAGITFRMKRVRTMANGNAHNAFSFQGRPGGQEVQITSTTVISESKGMSYEVVLHELVHAVTTGAVLAGKLPRMNGTELAKISQDLNKLFQAVQNRLANRAESAMNGDTELTRFEGKSLGKNNNAFLDTSEMIAWGLTSTDMQNFMENTPYKNGKSQWSFFVDTIRRLLGMPARQDTALSELMRIVQRMSKPDYAQGMRALRDGLFDGSLAEASKSNLSTDPGTDQELTTKSYQVDDNGDGVSKDPDFKPTKVAAAISKIVGAEKKEFSFMAEKVSVLIETANQVVGGLRAENRASKRSMVTDLWRSVMASLDGDMRVLVGKFAGDTIKSLPGMFHAVAGTDASSSQTFDEAVQSRNSRLRDVDEIISTMRDLGIKTKAQQDQVIRLVENPNVSRNNAMGKVANKIDAFLKEELAYLKEAGLDLGEVRDGYFPREVDTGKAAADSDKFIRQATKAYLEMGLSQEQAVDAAAAYWESVVYGVSGKPGYQARGGQTPSFIQSRAFTKAAANHLAEFRVTDIDAVLGQYTMRASKRAEIARRFGDNWANWSDMETQMKKDDPDVQNILPELRELVALSAGIQLHGMKNKGRVALSMLRTWTTLATLPKSAMASLGELVMAPMRGVNGEFSGDMAMQIGNLWDHFRHTARNISGLGREQQLQAAFEMAEDIGIIAGTGHNSLMAARFAGGDPVGKMQSDILASFFRRNMLEHLTNYTRVTAMQNAQVFFRRLAKQMETSPDKAGYFLRELGIAKGSEADFGKWLLKTEDGMPSMAAKGEFAKVYQNGLQRFVDQTVMRPSVSTRPKWASHPLGAVIFQLQAFGYAFQKNVLNRQIGVIKGLDGLDKLAYSASTVMGLALLVGAQGMFRYLRDEIFSEDINERKTKGAFIEGAFSQAGMFGVADPYLQSLSGVRYQKSITSMVLGPAMGGVATAGDAMLSAMLNNSDNTNTSERNMAKATYDWLLEPVMQGVLTVAPGGPLTSKLASFTTIYAIPKGREPFADAVAGERNSSKDKPPIKGTIEWLMGGDVPASSSKSTNRDGRGANGRETNR